MIWIIILGVYLLSMFLARRYMILAHSERGIYGSLNIERKDFIICVSPIINTFFLALWLIDYPIERDTDYSWFFKIKK